MDLGFQTDHGSAPLRHRTALESQRVRSLSDILLICVDRPRMESIRHLLWTRSLHCQYPWRRFDRPCLAPRAPTWRRASANRPSRAKQQLGKKIRLAPPTLSGVRWNTPSHRKTLAREKVNPSL